MRWPWKKKQGKKRLDRVKKRDSNPRLILIRQIVLGVLLALLLAGIITAVWYGTRVERYTVTEVSVIGGATIAHERIQEVTHAELEGTYYRLVPKRFSWTYPEAAIIEQVRKIERVKNVAVEKNSGREITVVFEEYRPFALWCADVEKAAADAAARQATQCLFLDRHGYAFAPAPKLEGSAFLRFSRAGHMPEQHTTGFSGEYIQTTVEFIESVYNQVGLNIIHVEQIADDEVIYHLSGGGELKTSLRMSNADTLDNLLTIFDSEAFAHLEPGKFKHIDLRYGNKVFVDDSDPNAPLSTSTATSTATSTP